MSELVLVLRRRLEDVVDWTHLGTDTLHTARKRKGLSYEAMGRLLNVSAKTWERWEKRGDVPRHMVTAVAGVLSLEIEEVAPLRAEVAAGEAEQLAEVRRLLTEVRDLRVVVDRIEAALHAPPRRARDARG